MTATASKPRQPKSSAVTTALPPRPSIVSELVLVTPSMAREWLSRSWATAAEVRS